MGQVVSTSEVGVDSLSPLDIVDLCKRNSAYATCAVDKNVNVTALFKNASNSLLNCLAIRNVHEEEIVSLAKFLNKLLANLLLIEGANNYVSATCDDTLGNLSADT